MGYRKEYIETLFLTRNQIEELKEAQYQMRMHGFKEPNESKLLTELSIFTNILSYAFMLPSPVTLASAVISALSSDLSLREACTEMSAHGEDYLEGVTINMDNDSTYGAAYVKLPFLEFVDEGFRFVSGGGIVVSKIYYKRLLKYQTYMMYGDDVKAVQNELRLRGINVGTADGWYGPKTKSGVITYQKNSGLSQDGIVGPYTWKSLFREI